jgi:hypothetical protein
MKAIQTLEEKIEFDVLPPPLLRSTTVLISKPIVKRKCNIKIDPEEAYGYIEEWFLSIFTSVFSLGLSRLREKTHVIHVSSIKQFFLHCGMISKTFFSKAIRPLSNFQWIDLHSFTFAIECLQSKQNTKKTQFISHLIRKKCFKLIFFFGLISTKDENPLTYEEMELVLRLALRNCPTVISAEILTHCFKGNNSSLLAFEDFFKFMLAML